MKEKSLLAMRLIQLKKENNMTQAQIAKEIGISRDAYARYEMDTMPKNETLVALAKLFGVTTDYLLGNSAFAVADEGQRYEAINIIDSSELSEFESLVVEKIRTMTPEERQKFAILLDE